MNMVFQSKNGFSLVEAVIFVGIMAIIVLGALSLYILQSKYLLYEIRYNETKTRLAAITNDISRTASQSIGIVSSVSINSVVYSTSANTAVFTVPAVNVSGNIIPGSSDTLVYTKSGNSLILGTLAAAGSKRQTGTQTVLEKINSINFNYSDNGNPTVSTWFIATLYQDVKAPTTTQTIYQARRIFLRNK